MHLTTLSDLVPTHNRHNRKIKNMSRITQQNNPQQHPLDSTMPNNQQKLIKRHIDTMRRAWPRWMWKISINKATMPINKFTMTNYLICTS